jgi:class 3 adenylate cyclase/pimeloyl-ACP methyl ester carboxylesterase
MEIHDTRYAKTPEGVYIAYQVVGTASIDLVWQLDHTGDIDLVWEGPLGSWLRAFARFARLILHDRRATGLSSRNVPPPNLETRVSDLRVVLDAAGSDRPVLAGNGEGGAPNVLFAATDPARVRSVVWFDPISRVTTSPSRDWVAPAYLEKKLRALDTWGTNDYGRMVAAAEQTYPGVVVSEEAVRWAGMLSRHTATPDVARELARIWQDTDVRSVLPSVRTPVLLIADEQDLENVAMARETASLMLGAHLEVISNEGDGNQAALDVLRRFLGIEPCATDVCTVLSTVLFTDIVGSTEKQAALGDHGWKDLLERHHQIVRDELRRWHGRENDTAGDGFYATFDGPARAIRCALAIIEEVHAIGIEVRAGVHTGECELIEEKCGGLTVSIGARVATTAGPNEVVVSQTVKDLVAGSGFSFAARGEHELKGVPDRWRLYVVGAGRDSRA